MTVQPTPCRLFSGLRISNARASIAGTLIDKG
jgi:hypothetical protein